MRVCRAFLHILGDQRGATAIEYGLLAALIIVAAIMVLGTVGTSLSSTFQDVANSF